MRFFRNCIIFSLVFLSNTTFAITFTKEATYYDDMFVDRTTSNGDIFSQSSFSAALCDEGTMGKLLHIAYGNTGVIVKANDRPNCSKHPQVIDLSKIGFETLSSLSKGRLFDLSVTPLDTVLPKDYIKKYISVNTFSDLGVTLAPNTPNTYTIGETILFKGKISGAKNGILYLSHNTTKTEIVTAITTKSDGSFESMVRPTLPGTYTLILSRGNEFQTELLQTIYILPYMEDSFSGILRNTVSPSLPRGEIRNGNFGIQGQKDTFSQYSLIQDTKKFTTSGKEFALLGDMPLLKVGTAKLETRAYGLSTLFSIDRILQRRPRVDNIFIDRKYIDENKVGAKVRQLRKNITVSFVVPVGSKVTKHWYVSYPDGSVKEFTFSNPYLNNDYLVTEKLITITIPTFGDGTYRIETVDDTGVAFFNIPVRVGTVWNIVEGITLDEKMQSRNNLKLIRIASLQSLNKLRASQDLSLLMEDSSISDIAQAKAEDMANRNYLGHVDPDGKKISSRLVAANIKFTSVGENVAGGSIISSTSGTTPISDIGLTDGLELSGSHKYNMLRSEWSKVGIGYATKNGKAYYVQIFVK